MMLTTFLLKFFDCALGTIKNVFLIKEKYLISSICNSLSAMLFIFVADIMANSDSSDKMTIALIVFLANLTGSYFPPKFLDKIEPAHMFIYVVTAKNIEFGKLLADTLKQLNIPVSTNVVYDEYTNKTLCVKVYSQSKEQSNIITRMLDKNKFKFHVVHLE